MNYCCWTKKNKETNELQWKLTEKQFVGNKTLKKKNWRKEEEEETKNWKLD